MAHRVVGTVDARHACVRSEPVDLEVVILTPPAFRNARRATRTVLVALAVLLGPVPARASLPTDLEASQLVTLVNNHRASLGRPPLAWDQRLADVAQAHTEDMVNRGFFSHTNPDGDTFADRIHAADISFVSASENIAGGFATASSAFSAWMLSPGHRLNLENANFTHHGIGYHQFYWTHVFIESPNTPVGVDPGSDPLAIRLSAWPSPARAGGRVRFTLPTGGDVTLRIVDVAGREVGRPLENAPFDAGDHEVAIDVGRLETGLYFVQLRTRTAQSTAKLLVVR